MSVPSATGAPPKKAWGIMLIAYGSSGPELEEPEWVVEYDPDGGDPDVYYPTGQVESSPDPAKAKRFDRPLDAMTYVRMPSRRTPYRPDGAPNRPLAAFTVSIEAIP